MRKEIAIVEVRNTFRICYVLQKKFKSGSTALQYVEVQYVCISFYIKIEVFTGLYFNAYDAVTILLHF